MSSELMGLALSGLVTGAIITTAMPMVADYQKRPFENQAGAKFEQFNDATRSYVRNNIVSIHDDSLDGTVDAIANISPATLISAGYLPSAWADDNFFGQSHYALAIDAGTADHDVYVMTFTYGGETLDPAKLSQVVANSGDDSGMISSVDNSNAVGRSAGWTIPLTDFAGGTQAPVVGNLAGFLHVTEEEAASGGGGGGGGGTGTVGSQNQDFGGYSATNIGQLTATNLNISGDALIGGGLTATTIDLTTLNVQNINGTGNWTTTGSIHADTNLTADGNIISNNGDITATNGTVTGVDVVSSGTGIKLSEAVANVFLVAHGDIVNKLTCLTGQTQEIFVIPSNMSDNGTGKPIHRFDGSATDNGTSWTIDLSVITEDGTVNPTSTYGRAVALVKCTS